MDEYRSNTLPEDAQEKQKEEKKTKTLTIVVSIAVALTLWIYVIGAVNPSTQTTVDNVPVRLLNTDSLVNRGLAIEGDGHYFVSVVVEGRRAEIGKMEISEVEATADLIGFGLGDNYVRVNVIVPASVSVIDVKPSKILVTIDELVAVNKPVEVIFGGAALPGMEEGAVDINPSEVEVSGARSEVARVKKVQVIVETSDFSAGGNTVQGEIIPVDEAGLIVEGVRLSSAVADVYAKLYSVKEVPVNIKTSGSTGEGYSVMFTGPGLVQIKGDSGTIKDIDAIDTIPIDLASISSSGEIDLKLDLPKGVFLARGSENPKAQVKIAPLKKKEIIYTTERIQIKGVPNGKKVFIQGSSVMVTAKGAEDLVNSLTADDVSLYVDVSGLSDGVHQIDVKTSYSGKLEIIVNPERIGIVMESDLSENIQEQ